MTIPELAAALGVAVPVLGGVDFLIRRWIERHRNVTIATLSERVQLATEELVAARDENERLADDLAESVKLQATTAGALGTAVARVADLEAENKGQVNELVELAELKSALDAKQKSHENRIKQALALEGQIWTQGVQKDTPEFVQLHERRTPIISVLNLKGGVGKTTLTANLAWALSARGYRVLLMDLDLQGSLSSLFFHNDELAQLAQEKKCLFQHFLARANTKQAGKLGEFAIPVPQLNRHCRIVAASDRLAYAEMSQTVRWLLRVGDGSRQWSGRRDGRMILRRALHRETFYRKYDVVLIDCAPLINLSCANALAASDHVLIPVTPSAKAIERVTPLLARVKEMKIRSVNPHLEPLGVVVNRTDTKALTPAEQMLLHDLPGQCHAVYGAPVHQFKVSVQQRNAVRDSEVHFVPLDERHVLRTTFEDLATELIGRLPLGCRTPDERANKKNVTPTGEAT